MESHLEICAFKYKGNEEFILFALFSSGIYLIKREQVLLIK